MGNSNGDIMSDEIDEERIDSVSSAFRYLLDQLKQDYIKEDTDEIVVSTVLLYDGLLGCSHFMTREELQGVFNEVMDAIDESYERATKENDLTDEESEYLFGDITKTTLH